MTSRVLRADTLLTFDAPRTARGDDLVGAIADAAVWLEGEGPRAKVRWCGRAAELPADAPTPSGAHALLMPAWVECHTHALFGAPVTPTSPCGTRAPATRRSWRRAAES